MADPSTVDYKLVDADNHYYEPPDCFTRYGDPAHRDLVFRSVNEGGTQTYLVGNRPYTYLEDPFNEIQVRPGALAEMLRSRYRDVPADGAVSVEPTRPDLENADVFVPMASSWQDREERLATMDEQDVESTIMLPTLGVTIEHYVSDDPVATYANLDAFNRWVQETWGLAYEGRIFSPVSVSLLDLDQAIRQVEWAISSGARFVSMKPGPVAGRSPADPYFDPVWARLHEAKVPVIFHVGEAGYNQLYSAAWGEAPNPSAYRASAFQWCNFMVERPIMDTLAALIFHNLFGRFPKLRVVSIENGSAWVPFLLYSMDKKKGFGRNGPWIGGRVVGRPSDIFKEHVRLTPFPEDNVDALIDAVGPEVVLFGSDYPHAEGIADPRDFIPLLAAQPGDVKRRILRENTLELIHGSW